MKSLFLSLAILASTLSICAQSNDSRFFGSIKYGWAILTEGRKNVAKRGPTSSAVVGYKLNEQFSADISTHIFATFKDDPESFFGFLGDGNLYFAGLLMLNGRYTIDGGWCEPYISAGMGTSRLVVGMGDEGTVSRMNLSYQTVIGIAFNGLTLAYSYKLLGKTPKEAILIPASPPVNVAYHNIEFGYKFQF